MKNSIGRYSLYIYPKNIIMKAIHDYNNIAEINMSLEQNYFVCEFSKCITDAEHVKNEFTNYLIEILNTHSTYNEI